MARRQSPFTRKAGDERYKNTFSLICEGAVTEKEYFQWLNRQYRDRSILIKVIKRPAHKSSPKDLIEAANGFPVKGRKRSDELWVICDKDQWTAEHFEQLLNWKRKKRFHHLAVSAPKFEYWILLHKSDCRNLSVQEVDLQFKRWMGEGKHIKEHLLSLEKARQAAQRAQEKHKSCDGDIPTTCGSTVYRLIEKLDRIGDH